MLTPLIQAHSLMSRIVLASLDSLSSETPVSLPTAVIGGQVSPG